ncbi:MAG: hypothetical protein D6725_07930 [Planctomycetota bacterium]|nr:MAG: hypothetical protein D6725_07930 [Planctomycetota bacterium]
MAATSPTEAASDAAGTSPAQTPGADETSVTADRTDAPAASSASPRVRWRFHWYYLNPLWLARAGLRVVVRAARSGLWRLAGGVRDLLRRALRAVARQLTPLRVIFAAIVLLIALTAHFRMRQVAREKAAIAFRDAAASGMQSFAAGDFFTAAQQLETAVEALALIDVEGARAQEIRIAAREAAAAADLLDATLDDVIREAERHRRRGRLEEWQEYFRVNFAGQWLVFETAVERYVAEDGSVHYRVAPFYTEQGTRVELDVDLPIFSPLWDHDTQPRPVATDDKQAADSVASSANDATTDVIFAVQLSSCTWEADGSWHVRFNLGTACLWAHLDAYRRLLGLPESDRRSLEPFATELKRVERILKRQASVLGITPKNEAAP